MGALGAANELARAPDIAIGKIDPRAGGVHHDLRPHCTCLAGNLIAQKHFAARRAERPDVSNRVRSGERGFSVLNQFKAQALRIGDLGIVVSRRADYVGIQSWAERKSRAPGVEPMPGQGRFTAGEDVIQRQPGLDEERSPVARLGRPVQQISYPRNDPRHPVEDRNRGCQRLHVMGRVSEQTVPFSQGLSHQPKLRILQIAEAAVNDPRHGRAGSGAEIGLLDQQHVDPL